MMIILNNLMIIIIFQYKTTIYNKISYKTINMNSYNINKSNIHKIVNIFQKYNWKNYSKK